MRHRVLVRRFCLCKRQPPPFRHEDRIVAEAVVPLRYPGDLTQQSAFDLDGLRARDSGQAGPAASGTASTQSARRAPARHPVRQATWRRCPASVAPSPANLAERTPGRPPSLFTSRPESSASTATAPASAPNIDSAFRRALAPKLASVSMGMQTEAGRGSTASAGPSRRPNSRALPAFPVAKTTRSGPLTSQPIPHSACRDTTWR